MPATPPLPTMVHVIRHAAAERLPMHQNARSAGARTGREPQRACSAAWLRSCFSPGSPVCPGPKSSPGPGSSRPACGCSRDRTRSFRRA